MTSVFVLVLSAFASVQAAPVAPTDLFLSPTLIADDFYETNLYSLGASPKITKVFDAAFIGGTLLSVRVLPVLNPNPSPFSVEGEYTPDDLAAINASNFDSYFFRRPGIDYTADLTPDAVTLEYTASGQYFVAIDAMGSTGRFTRMFHEHVDDFFAEDPAAGVKDKGGVTRRIADPQADLILVSDGDPADNGALANAFAHLTNEGHNVGKANSLEAAKDAIKAAFEANGNKKIKVALVGHGRSGSIKIGTQRINNDPDGDMTPKDFQMMIDEWVEQIEFYSCNTAQDAQFLRDFAESIGIASGFTTTVTFAAPSFFGLFSGFVDTGASAKKATDVVPEPATVGTLLAGLVAVCARRWRARRLPSGRDWRDQSAR